jgi:hypothetical protein
MSAPKLESVKTRLETVIALARLLERVERSGQAPHPEQYRALVDQLGQALDAELPADALKAVLDAFPAAVEVYENRHYAQSGLSRSPLERSVATEMLASQVLHRIAARDWQPPQPDRPLSLVRRPLSRPASLCAPAPRRAACVGC